MLLKVALNIPSGKLVCANDLREFFPLKDDTEFDVNETVGIKQTIEAYAKAGMFHVYVGNSCPELYLKGNRLLVANAAYDDNTGDAVIPESWGESVGGITTDLWWYSIADYDDYISLGGVIDKHHIDVVDVEPGRYVLSHELEIDRDAEMVIYATIEKSDEKIIPWKMPEEGIINAIMKSLPERYHTVETVRVRPASWRPDLSDDYRFRTYDTKLFINSKYEKIGSQYKKVAYKLWGSVFDGSINVKKAPYNTTFSHDVFIEIFLTENDLKDTDKIVKMIIKEHAKKRQKRNIKAQGIHFLTVYLAIKKVNMTKAK